MLKRPGWNLFSQTELSSHSVPAHPYGSSPISTRGLHANPRVWQGKPGSATANGRSTLFKVPNVLTFRKMLFKYNTFKYPNTSSNLINKKIDTLLYGRDTVR